MWSALYLGVVVAALPAVAGVLFEAAGSRKQLIAHRGASAYAPEHTLEAYRLALEQRADFVEPDLAVTRDGVLICLHDDTLERTTNVAQVFPVQHLADGLHHAFDPATRGTGIVWSDLGVLALWLAAGLVVALVRFTWTPVAATG